MGTQYVHSTRIEYDAEASGGDYGDTYRVTCPKCGVTVYCRRFNMPTCNCGYGWTVEVSITATGTRETEDTREGREG